MFFSLDIAKPVKQEWENIAAAPLLFLERQFVNVGLKSNLTGFLLCAPQSYKSHTFCTVTYGSSWRQCAAVTAVMDSRIAAPCRCFIMDSLGSDIREDNFMQWSTGKWTLPHSRLLINRLDHFLIFIIYFHLIISLLHLFHHYFPIHCVLSPVHIHLYRQAGHSLLQVLSRPRVTFEYFPTSRPQWRN